MLKRAAAGMRSRSPATWIVNGAFFSIAVVLWVRYALHAAVMSLWVGFSRDKTLRTTNPLFQIARGALHLAPHDFAVAERDLKFFDREAGTRTARVPLA